MNARSQSPIATLKSPGLSAVLLGPTRADPSKLGSSTFRFKRRPLISAVKGLIAGTFLGGCRLGMQQPPPMPPANAPSDAGSATAAPKGTQAHVDTAGGGDGGTDAR